MNNNKIWKFINDNNFDIQEDKTITDLTFNNKPLSLTGQTYIGPKRILKTDFQNYAVIKNNDLTIALAANDSRTNYEIEDEEIKLSIQAINNKNNYLAGEFVVHIEDKNKNFYKSLFIQISYYEINFIYNNYITERKWETINNINLCSPQEILTKLTDFIHSFEVSNKILYAFSFLTNCLKEDIDNMLDTYYQNTDNYIERIIMRKESCPNKKEQCDKAISYIRQFKTEYQKKHS